MKIRESCEGCAHRDVCRFSDDYKKVLDAALTLKLTKDGPDGAWITPVSDLEFLDGVHVSCKYFYFRTRS